MKLWIIQWGYHTCLDGGSELDSIWTNETKAYEYLRSIAQNKDLQKHKNRKTGQEFSNTYTDGDYWISLSEVYSDTEWLHGEPE